MTSGEGTLKKRFKLNLPTGYSYAVTDFAGNGYRKGASCTWGWKNPTTGASPQILCDDLRSAVASAFGAGSAHYASTFKLVSVTGKNGPVDTGAYFVDSANTTLGTSATDAYAPNVAVCVRRSTGLGGKHGHGRLFFPPPIEADIDAGGSLTSAAQTAIQGYIDAIVGFMTEAGWVPFLLHRFPIDATGAPTETPVAPTQITAHSVETYVATQRRRLVRA